MVESGPIERMSHSADQSPGGSPRQTGVGMRLRRIEGESIRPDAVVDGEILFEANYRSQIDNMEGLDAIPEPDGSVRLIVVSDDNHSILQRTLMLEFRLQPQG